MNNIDPIKIIRSMLGGKTVVEFREIETAVDNFLKMNLPIPETREVLIRKVEELYIIRQDDFSEIIKEEENLPWLSSKREFIDFKNGFWGNYRQYLEEEKNFPLQVINKLDRITDSILDNLFDPTLPKTIINKKGLVVGQVQSGKTSNYTGLMCKAADAGFGLIIVLAGLHNNLRSQTQIRIDEGFLGFDTQHTRALDAGSIKIGVGKPGFSKINVAHSLTSSIEKGDFTMSAANALAMNFDTKDPIIAVIKKNTHPLTRILSWLRAQSNTDTIFNKALLVIDDEADNASINTSKYPDEQTKINELITSVIGLFGKSAYVGYTATPFANIFTPLDDYNLFPRNFIKNIPAPSNYIGPEKIFGFSPLAEDEKSDFVLPIVNQINDYEQFFPNKHKKYDQLPSGLPDSLKRAIRCFILTCAIRRLRGQTSVHNSMLIHVSLYTTWQNHITELVENQYMSYRFGIDQNDFDTIELFRQTYEEDDMNYKSYVTTTERILDSKLANLDLQIQSHRWKDVLAHLNDAAIKIKVAAINGGSGEVLDYFNHKRGLSIIAIGGNKLSRGLTLEGLSVSYYLRASKMYDTLMQMGRWFGYRPGYPDLCRLFTSRQLNEWFCHITQASEELREEFEYMSDVAGYTPEQYTLKVRTHPGVLQISATNKMRAASTIEISWAGRLVESYEFKKNPYVINHNFEHTQHFFKRLGVTPVPKKNALVWYDIDAETIISFFEGIKSMENLKKAEPEKLIRFIKTQLKNQELTDWRVALMTKERAGNSSTFVINNKPVQIGQWKRTEDENNSDENVYYLKKSHIISPKDEFIDLTKQEWKKAMEMTIERRTKPGTPNYPSGYIVRNELRNPKQPLLLIYLLDHKESIKDKPLPDETSPFVGYAISFPKSKHSSPASYAVHEELLDTYIETEEDFDDE